MTAEQKKSPPVTKTVTINPWIIFAVALVAYALTLNRWVTLRGLPWIAATTGWDWHFIPTEWRPFVFCALVVCRDAAVSDFCR